MAEGRKESSFLYGDSHYGAILIGATHAVPHAALPR